MLVLNERIIDVPVMSLQTGTELARTKIPIIDPRELKIIGFYVEGPGVVPSPAILTIEDIREISNLGFIVDDANSIISPDDLVRLRPVLSYNFELLGKQVIEDNGHKVGKVGNYAVDAKSFFIMQIHAQPGIMQGWDTAEVIIGRTQIIEVTDSSIVIRAATVKDEAGAKHIGHLMPNPFRRRHTQPEVPHASTKTSPEARP